MAEIEADRRVESDKIDGGKQIGTIDGGKQVGTIDGGKQVDTIDRGKQIETNDGGKQIDTIDCGKQMEIDKGESQPPCTKSRYRKRKRNAHCCCTCHDPKTRHRAKTRKPPLPEGFGYVPSAICVDKNGNYIPRFSDRVAYMSCHRCGMKGDHWDPFCPNSINDPPDSGEAAPTRNPSWNYILRNFNLKEYLEKKNKTDGKPEPPRRKVVKSKAQACPIHSRNKTRARTEKPSN